jgi:hypothetical protein
LKHVIRSDRVLEAAYVSEGLSFFRLGQCPCVATETYKLVRNHLRRFCQHLFTQIVN